MNKSASFYRFILSLAALIQPYAKSFCFGLLALTAGSLINLILPQLAKYLLDSDFGKIALEHPLLTIATLAGVFAIQNLFFYLRSSLFSKVGIAVGKELKERLFAELINKPMEFHDTNNWADIRSRLISDIQLIQDAVSLRLSVFIRYTLQVLVAAILMIFISTKLTLLTLSVVPLLILGGVLMGKRLKRLSADSQRQIAIANGRAEEGLGQIRLVKLLGSETDYSKKFTLDNQQSARTSSIRAGFAALFSSSMNFLLTITIVAVLIYGLAMVDYGHVSKGDFTAFSLYGLTVAVSFAFAISAYSELLQASAAGDRVFALIPPNQQVSRVESPLLYENKAQSIEFKNIKFFYPSRKSQLIFDDLNFKIDPNSCTALVGSSGSGKSTVLNLIAGLYSPESGNVLVGDIGFADKINFAKTSLLGVVPQDGFLISGSIRENLCLGASREYTDNELREVLGRVKLEDLLLSQGLNLDSELGERGSQLSGGQRQRIAIARALLKHPSVLMLDEATASLDPESEAVLLEILRELKKTTTIILVSHRLSSLSIADRILLMSKGKIIQDGSYHQVVQSDGLFKRMLDANLIQEG